MAKGIFILTFFLTVGDLARCQDWENLLFIKMEEVLEKQEATLSQLKEMQEKQEHVEGKLQELHFEMERLKGTVIDNQDSLQRIHQETKVCLGREDLERFNNISLAGQQELESSLHQEISGVMSLLETDECSEGSHNCGDHEACTDKLVGFTCYCTEGFAWNGSHCEDIDECTRGKADCSPQASCRNSVGSYSCSCNPPFEGDGRSCSCPNGLAQNGSNCEDIDECAQGQAECSHHAACKNSVGSYSCSCNPPFEGDGQTCEFSCEPSGKVYEGLGCIRAVYVPLTWHQMNDTCQKAGWRLAQDVQIRNIKDVDRAFPYGGWVGVFEGKWLESGVPLQEDHWEEGRPSDPLRRCGYIMWNFTSRHLYTVNQYKCSLTALGYCQFLL